MDRTINYWSSQYSGRRLSRRRVVGATGLGAAAIAIVGCGDDDGDARSSGQTQPTSASTGGNTSNVDPNGTLRVALAADQGSLDIQEVGGVVNYWNGEVHFDYSVVTHPVSNKVAPNFLSADWVEGNTALLLKIQNGIVSHDGAPYTAEVAKFSLDRASERGAYAGRSDWKTGRPQTQQLGEATIIDNLTLRVPVPKPSPGTPAGTIGILRMVPKAYIEKEGDKKFAVSPVGTGPYKFVSRVADTELRSTRFDQYFRSPEGAEYGPWKPFHKDLVTFFRPEPLSRVAALDASEIDYVPDLPSDLAKQFEGKKRFTVLYTSIGWGNHIQFNTGIDTDPKTGGPNPWRDKRVRMAANLAIDKDAYIKSLLTGKERLAYGLSSLSLAFPKDKLEQMTWKYDPRRAKQLMTEAGYEKGIDTDLYLATGYAGFARNEDIALVVQQSLAAIGIRTNIIKKSFADAIPLMRDKNLPGLFYWSTSTGSDPASNADSFWAKDGLYNRTPLPESNLQTLYEQQRAEFDPTKRQAILEQCWLEHYSQASWIFLHEPIQTSVYNSDRLRYVVSGGDKALPHIPLAWEFQVLRT